MGLKRYKAKRTFSQTPEPRPKVVKTKRALRFVVQKHAARALHYDFRLELDGVLKSWAVPKGPPAKPKDKRLAVMTEDHPLAYGKFEGTIPKGNYGAGTVEIWDAGTYGAAGTTGRNESEAAIRTGLLRGSFGVILKGKKLKGEYILVRFRRAEKNAWLFIKK